MSQKGKSNQKGYQVSGLKIAVSAMGMSLSFMVALIVMAMAGELNVVFKFVLIGVMSLVFLLCTYFFVQAILRMSSMKQEQMDQIYEDLYKSSKATYLLMRNAFEEMDESLAVIEEKAGAPADELMEAQKSVAKVIISRNKENADALMNSNDKLLDKVFDFESMLEELEESLVVKQQNAMGDSLKEISQKQMELVTMIKDLEIEMRKELANVTLASSQMAMNQQMAMPQMMSQQTMMPQQIEAPVMSELQSEISDEDLDMMIANTEDLSYSEMEAGGADVISFDTTEEDVLSGLEIPEEDLLGGFGNEEQDLFAGMENMEEDPLVGLDELFADDFATTENVADESVEELIPEILEELISVNEATSQENLAEVEEPVVNAEDEEEEKPPMPDLSDPNKVMSPEDIAALIANL